MVGGAPPYMHTHTHTQGAPPYMHTHRVQLTGESQCSWGMSERRERKKGRKGEEVEHVVTINKCIYMDMVTKTFHTFPLGDITPLSCGIQTLQHTPTGEYMIGTKVLTCYLATYMVSMPHNTTEHPHAPSPPHAPPTHMPPTPTTYAAESSWPPA